MARTMLLAWTTSPPRRRCRRSGRRPGGGLRRAHEHQLPEVTLAALRCARAHDPRFLDFTGKRGAELL
ncbi:hypothetical protein [Streptomyces mirabilis]|uniref:hypothetical protein n=1 Tax=Streptomyces mirabilis TaxID=68239 RepID=UPI0036D7F89D